MARRGENIRKRKDGRWEARSIVGYDSTGKASYKYFYAKTYAEVKQKRNACTVSESKGNIKKDHADITVEQQLNEWLFYIKTEVKESTYSRYVFIVERHIKPELGKIRLVNMSNETIDEFVRRKLIYGRLSGSGGLSPKTVASILSVIKLAFIYGQERGHNCPEYLRIHNPRQTIPRIQILDSEEQKRLEQCILNNPAFWKSGIILSLYTGLRIGEVCALRWEDIEFDTKMLYVQRTIMRIQDTDPEAAHKTKIVIGKPKTECSNRNIPIPEFLLSYLKTYQRSRQSYVLTGADSYLEPRNYYLKYKKIMRECGLEKYNYHALRHTFATRCIENGFDVKCLSEILGHSDVSTTLRRYVHPSMELKRQQMDRLKNTNIWNC